MTGRTVDRPVRNPDRYRTGPDRTGTERPVAGTGSIYGAITLEYCAKTVVYGAILERNARFRPIYGSLQ